MSEVIELTRALVALDTVNPALVPGAPGERPAVDLLADRLDARRFEIEIVGPDDRPSLVATHRGRPGGRTLALNGHLDTVGVEGMDDPFSGRIDGDRMYGRGTCDMKAGVAAMVVAAERTAQAGHDGDIVLALVADEEHGSVGCTAVLEHLSGRLPDACIVGEPTWLHVIVAHRGFSVVEVELHGRAAHSSRPHEGVNAVALLGRLLVGVEERDDALSAGEPHPYAGHGSLTATVAHGGTAPFTLAAHASALVERRTIPGEPLHAGLHDVEAIMEQLALPGACRELIARDAWELSEAALDLVALLPFEGRAGAPYWMESALWEAAGVPTVVYGPAGGGLHTDVEWVELGQLRAYEAALESLIPTYLQLSNLSPNRPG
ncbi:MAG TPA: M20/M25/M40 family metallo-hydrolase [Solirubrobacter sp.]|nr:M20/M25/M40 family metallo-hydrolase [Solirubrobacter sp.]